MNLDKKIVDNSRDFLDEICIRLTTNIELLSIIMESAENDANLLGSLLVLQRDIASTTDCILKYLGED